MSACQTPPPRALQTVEKVDVPRFMGDWYVIACIPTFIERQAYNAVESYELAPDGRVRTVFTFRKGAFDGPEKRYSPVGTVLDASGAVWGMQFIWPIKSDYRVTYLTADYTQTIISRQKRDYVWIMARTPMISDADYRRDVELVGAQGYDIAALRKVPQQPLSQRPAR
jgi:apolipoprotein D and lipocalin family protein